MMDTTADALDRLLAGDTQSGNEPLVAFVRRTRHGLSTPPTQAVAAAHLQLMTQMAARHAHLVPDPARTPRWQWLRGAATAAAVKLAALATAGLAATGALAVTGQLPDPAQRVAADLAHLLGLELSHPDDASKPNPHLGPAPQSITAEGPSAENGTPPVKASPEAIPPPPPGAARSQTLSEGTTFLVSPTRSSSSKPASSNALQKTARDQAGIDRRTDAKRHAAGDHSQQGDRGTAALPPASQPGATDRAAQARPVPSAQEEDNPPRP
ncbi:MAG: hypothetical protein M3O70_26920 [Actinomycetota bacterium]|nr:hypothetical protein [Actinomycetota bacterium]